MDLPSLLPPGLPESSITDPVNSSSDLEDTTAHIPHAISSVVGVATSAANSVVSTVSHSAETIQRLEKEVNDDLQRVRTTFQKNDQVQDPGNWIRVCRVLAMASLLATLAISFTHLIIHMRRFSNPPVQKNIARIILLVPVYGVMSWVAMMLPGERAIFDLVRDTYEAFALYSFLNFLFSILGGEDTITHALANAPPVPWMWPLDRFLPPIRVTPRLFDLIKLCVLQFVLVVPFCSVLGFGIRAAGGTTDPYDFSLWNASLWSSFLQSTSISLSMNALWVFYLCTRDLFPPADCVRPLSQFLTIKAVVFLPYWQNLALTLLGHSGLLPLSFGTFSAAAILIITEEFLVCIELLPLCMLHCWAFPVELASVEQSQSIVKYCMLRGNSNRDLVGATHAESFRDKIDSHFAPLGKKLFKEQMNLYGKPLANFASPAGSALNSQFLQLHHDFEGDSYGSTQAPSSGCIDHSEQQSDSDGSKDISPGATPRDPVTTSNSKSSTATLDAMRVTANVHLQSTLKDDYFQETETRHRITQHHAVRNPLFSDPSLSSKSNSPPSMTSQRARPTPPSSHPRGVADILQFVASAYAPQTSTESGQSSLSEALSRMRTVFDTRDVFEEVTGLVERTRLRLYDGEEENEALRRKQEEGEDEEDELISEGLDDILVF